MLDFIRLKLTYLGLLFCISISVMAGNISSTLRAASYDSSKISSLRPVGSWMYIAYFDTSEIKVCTINLDGTLDTCRQTGLDKSGKLFAFNAPMGIGAYKSTAGKHFVYITSLNQNNIAVCALNESSGALSDCEQANTTTIFRPSAITIVANNNQQAIAYIANLDLDHPGLDAVTVCKVNELSGHLTDCSSTGPLKVPYNADTVDLAYHQGIIYVLESDIQLDPILYNCQLNEQDGKFSTCNQTGEGLAAAGAAMKMGITNDTMYITSKDTDGYNRIYACELSDHQVKHCQRLSTPLKQPVAIGATTANQFIYVGDNGMIDMCILNQAKDSLICKNALPSP